MRGTAVEPRCHGWRDDANKLFLVYLLVSRLAVFSIAGATFFELYADAFVRPVGSLRRRPASSRIIHGLAPGESIVERCYEAWNRRRMSDAAACFDDKFTYDDGQCLGSIDRKSDLERLFRIRAKALPRNSVVVLDHVAKCDESGNLGAQWHVENEDGSPVPFTRGCGFYTVNARSGLIKTGFHVSEMIVKPSKRFSDFVVSSASGVMQATNLLGGPTTSKTNFVEEAGSGSIIKKYFRAWNRRDMEAALDCFSDDCVYETEDPVFVQAFRGKDELRGHLLRNADVLPSACRIVLDDLAVDTANCTIGVRWHLEANGVSIPNLRGCSMYTTEKQSGLLKSGFDVTEAPVKLPAVAQDMLAIPLGNILF